MADITLVRRSLLDESTIGAIVCHTPKTFSDSKCRLIKTNDELIQYFGDPYIDPYMYSDLLIASKLLTNGIPLYISSVNDTYVSNDGFTICDYNGYTEFVFNSIKDDSGEEELVPCLTYELKSDIKFCQPLINRIEVSNEKHRIHLYVGLYYIDIYKSKTLEEIKSLDSNRLYRTFHFVFDLDASKTTNDVIENDFKLNGLELHLSNEVSLVDYFVNLFKFKDGVSSDYAIDILLKSPTDDENFYYDVETSYYRYNIHTSDYKYDFEDNDKILLEYYRSINYLVEMKPEPLMMCLGKLVNISHTESEVYSHTVRDLDPEYHIAICNHLMESFDENSNTYLFINTSDLSVSSVIDLLNCEKQYTYSPELLTNYNCDLFFGYATDLVSNSLSRSYIQKANYSAALLSFYNLMRNNVAYITNNFVSLNIANRCVKLVISEKSASKLKEAHCNSIVLFDIGSPSSYGDRSLSRSSNLQYSHISRSIVFIRRLINEYIETRKFTHNTLFNTDIIVNYIKKSILDTFVSIGTLQYYNVTYNISGKTVNMQIDLLFSQIAENIILNFTI